VSEDTYRFSNLLVVGGNSSIGGELILKAQRHYEFITATYRSQNVLNDTSVKWLELDVSKIKSIDKFLKSILKQKFETIIYTIGVESNFNLQEISLRKIQNYFETHIINTSYLITKLIYNLNEKSNFIYLSSRASIFPSHDFCYAASKSAISSLVVSLSKQATHEQGFYVVAPGLIIGSGMYNRMQEKYIRSHRLRSGGKLLNVEQLASEILSYNFSKFENGSIIQIGPSYR